MNRYIGVYNCAPCPGDKSGTLVSEEGAFSNPISATLDASKKEVQYIFCAIRATEGYESVGDVTLKFVGDNASKWSLALDNGYTQETAKQATYTNSLTITEPVKDVNTCFVVKVETGGTESPVIDKGVVLNVVATMRATE